MVKKTSSRQLHLNPEYPSLFCYFLSLVHLMQEKYFISQSNLNWKEALLQFDLLYKHKTFEIRLCRIRYKTSCISNLCLQHCRTDHCLPWARAFTSH